jgi:hypothetical protein
MTQAKFNAKLEEDIKCLLGRIETLEGEKEDLKKRVDGLEERLEKTVKEEIRKEGDSYAEKLKRNLVTTSGEVIMKGVTDLQERKYNVVFRGIKESGSTDGLERKENDMQEIASMVHSVDQTVDIRGAVVAARRLGKKEEGKDFRPLLVKVKSQDLREALIRMNGRLKEVNRQKGTRHRIDPDMTKEQMARLDNMWTEAREKSKNGVKFYVVGKENPILRSRELSEEEKENAKK